MLPEMTDDFKMISNGNKGSDGRQRAEAQVRLLVTIKIICFKKRLTKMDLNVLLNV